MNTTLDKNNPKEFINTLKNITYNKKVLFACVGTDRSTGDSLGCLTGSFLKELGYNVVGTLDNPLHAENLIGKVAKINKMHVDLVIVIDACLGKMENISKIRLENCPLKAGTAVGKDLIEFGDYSLTGVVNIGGFMEFHILQNTRLSVVMNMSKFIVNIIKIAMPLDKNKYIKSIFGFKKINLERS